MTGRGRLRSYKQSGRTDENRRRERASKIQLQRNTNRGNDLARRRGLEVSDEEPEQAVQVVDPVRVKLAQWKKKKEAKVQQEKQTAKPAFKFGMVKHDDTHLYRPAGESKKFKPPQNVKPVSVQRPTRTLRSGNRYLQGSPLKANLPTVAQALNDFVTALKSVPEEDPESEMNTTFEMDCDVKESAIVESNDAQESELNSTFSKNVTEDKAELAVTNIEIDTEEPSVTEQPILQMSEAAVLNTVPSPFHEESAKERGFEKIIPEPCESRDQHDAQYFRSLHISTVGTLEQLCEKWEVLREQAIPAHVQDLVDVAVGYARLFIKEKLQQFDELISDHLKESTQPPVLIEDLEGFWSLVDIQVQDVHRKFANLNTLQQNGWKEPEPEVRTRALRGKPKKKAPVGNGKSNARAFIELARKQMNPHKISSPKPMSPAVMRVSLMAKNIAVTPPKRDSVAPVTPRSNSKSRTRKTEKENMEPANHVPEIGQCLKPAETPVHDPAIMKVIQMAAGGGSGTPVMTPLKRDSVVPVTAMSKNKSRTRKTEKENTEPASHVPENGQCLKPAETPLRDPAMKATQMAAGGSNGTPVMTPRQSKRVVMETTNSAVRRSMRILNKGKDGSSDLISWDTPS